MTVSWALARPVMRNASANSSSEPMQQVSPSESVNVKLISACGARKAIAAASRSAEKLLAANSSRRRSPDASKTLAINGIGDTKGRMQACFCAAANDVMLFGVCVARKEEQRRR